MNPGSLYQHFQFSREQNLVEKFVREKTLAVSIRRLPFFHHDAFDASHSLFFGDARVGDAIQVAIKQVYFLFRGKMTVLGDALVVIVRDKIVKILLKIRARAANAVHEARPVTGQADERAGTDGAGT